MEPTSAAKFIDEISNVFKAKLKERLLETTEKEMERFKSEDLPALIANAAGFIEVQMLRNPNFFGTEISFVIRDMAEYRKYLANT